jgi:hypothetical protein
MLLTSIGNRIPLLLLKVLDRYLRKQRAVAAAEPDTTTASAHASYPRPYKQRPGGDADAPRERPADYSRSAVVWL